MLNSSADQGEAATKRSDSASRLSLRVLPSSCPPAARRDSHGSDDMPRISKKLSLSPEVLARTSKNTRGGGVAATSFPGLSLQASAASKGGRFLRVASA